jgi:hypothetical protein
VKYFPIPVALLEIGKPLPVDVWSSNGNLLLRKGQPVTSEEHREKLHAHHASSTLADAVAWQRAYERMVHSMLQQGMDVEEVARLPMPSEIRASDYVEGQQVRGGWLDLQEVLRGILYQGGLAINPLQRLAGIEKKALELLTADPDDSLFSLFQALADNTRGYCATHALLCAVVSKMTAAKLGISNAQSHALFAAALTMNIGMAREQDSMSLQSLPPTPWQRQLIEDHPQKSLEILTGFGVDNPEQLDIVRWHHAADSVEALGPTKACRELLVMVDGFIARMASRKTRAPISPVKAVRDMVLGAQGQAIGVGSAMAQAVGFYPPGTYVQLVNGEQAVVIARGVRANHPQVASLVNAAGLPFSKYIYHDTSDPSYAVRAPLNAEKIKVKVSLEKVARMRAERYSP